MVRHPVWDISGPVPPVHVLTVDVRHLGRSYLLPSFLLTLRDQRWNFFGYCRWSDLRWFLRRRRGSPSHHRRPGHAKKSVKCYSSRRDGRLGFVYIQDESLSLTADGTARTRAETRDGRSDSCGLSWIHSTRGWYLLRATAGGRRIWGHMHSDTNTNTPHLSLLPLRQRLIVLVFG